MFTWYKEIRKSKNSQLTWLPILALLALLLLFFGVTVPALNSDPASDKSDPNLEDELCLHMALEAMWLLELELQLRMVRMVASEIELSDSEVNTSSSILLSSDSV